MVVEDEPDIYEVLLAMFEMWGIEGVAFVDGEEAVAWIDDVDHSRFQGELPELALLDIRLPGEIDGVQVGERLRQSTVLGEVAIVLTTAYSLSQEQQKEAIDNAGADLWLPKPLPKFTELQGILEKVIAERRAKRDGASNSQGADKDKDDVAEVVDSNGDAKSTEVETKPMPEADSKKSDQSSES